VSSVGLEALSKLPHLKKFVFQDADWVVFGRCILLSAQFLPQLRVAGVDIMSKVGTGEFSYTYSIHNAIVERQQPVQLDLEEVMLKGGVQLHPTCRLPRLKAMHLADPSKNFLGLVDRFPSVTELGFYNASSTRILELLPLVGCRLSSLVIEESRKFLPLAEILTLCPNLKNLQLFRCRLIPSVGGPQVVKFKWPDEDLFQSLEHVQIETRYDALPEGFMKKV
jgi:hypothetical protein